MFCTKDAGKAISRAHLNYTKEEQVITTHQEGEKPFEVLLREAREAAAKFNPLLRTQAGAAEALGVADGNTVSKWERGECVPSNHNIKAMADVYNAPHLLHLCCSRVCPIGRERVSDPRLGELESQALYLRKCSKEWDRVLETILDTATDGKITSDEVPAMEEVLKYLSLHSAAIESFKITVEKALKEGGTGR